MDYGTFELKKVFPVHISNCFRNETTPLKMFLVISYLKSLPNENKCNFIMMSNEQFNWQTTNKGINWGKSIEKYTFLSSSSHKIFQLQRNT